MQLPLIGAPGPTRPPLTDGEQAPSPRVSVRAVAVSIPCGGVQPHPFWRAGIEIPAGTTVSADSCAESTTMFPRWSSMPRRRPDRSPRIGLDCCPSTPAASARRTRRRKRARRRVLAHPGRRASYASVFVRSAVSPPLPPRHLTMSQLPSARSGITSQPRGLSFHPGNDRPCRAYTRARRTRPHAPLHPRLMGGRARRLAGGLRSPGRWLRRGRREAPSGESSVVAEALESGVSPATRRNPRHRAAISGQRQAAIPAEPRSGRGAARLASAPSEGPGDGPC